MKLKYYLKKNINIKTGYLIAIIITSILIVSCGFSYAIFTVHNESKGALNIVAGNLYSYITSQDLDKNNSIALEPKNTVIINVKLMNVNSIKVKSNLYYETNSQDVLVSYVDEEIERAGIVLDANGTEQDSKEVAIRISNNSDNEVATVTFDSSVGLATVDLNFTTDQLEITKYDSNPYIVNAYNYDDNSIADDYCLTGEETTCKVSDCYNSKVAGSCPSGTIIKYKVTNQLEKIFYVIEDQGSKIVMQQRENTITNVAWNETSTTTNQGPLTVLAKLEMATKDWVNVPEQIYTMGTTVFNNNKFTSCSTYNTCSSNEYTLTEKKVKARLITVQEASFLSCSDSINSCPRWMNNYLHLSKNYNGTEEDNLIVSNQYNVGYWTMNSQTGGKTAYYLNNAGMLTSDNGEPTKLYGARAVITVNK